MRGTFYPGKIGIMGWMRWLLGVIGALALLAAAWLGLRERWTRPVLGVALQPRTGSSEDAAAAEGVALALEDRDERGGRFRVVTVSRAKEAAPNSKTISKLW